MGTSQSVFSEQELDDYQVRRINQLSFSKIFAIALRYFVENKKFLEKEGFYNRSTVQKL